MIFIVLLLNSVIRFLLGNLGVDALFVGAVTNGLLMAVPFGFILVNLQEIYLRKSNLYIKLIIPWIFFMWLTSFGLMARYSFRDTLRVVCFQSGPLLMFLCFYIQGKSCTARNFKVNQRLFFILTLVTIYFFSFELVTGRKYFTDDFLRVGNVLFLTMLLPWISILNNKVLRYILLASLSCLALFSMKRSVLFQISVGGFFYVLIQNMIIEQRKKGLFLLLTPFILLGLFQILSYVNRTTSGALLERVQYLGRGSGRLDIWVDLWRQYKTWSFGNQVVGKGYYITREMLGELRAHNDYIESLLGYGAIGFLANVFFSICLSIKAAGMVLRRHPYAASFAFGIISFWIISLVSYNLYYMLWSLYLLAFLGYICGIDQQDQDFRTFYPDLTIMELHQLRQEGFPLTEVEQFESFG
jgi:hypothetical protein